MKSKSKTSGYFTTFLLIACCIAPFIVGASVYFPIASKYWSANPNLDQSHVEALKQRVSDNAELLNMVSNSADFGIRLSIGDTELVSAASGILDGNIDVRKYGAASITLPFSAETLTSAPPSIQLPLASLLPANMLLDAYFVTGDAKFLNGSLQRAVSFLAIEGGLLLPNELIWNDHAIAVRTVYFCRLLMALVVADTADDADFIYLLRALDRHVQMLSADGLYTFKSNHGLMQNIAFLKAAVFVPFLPSIEKGLEKVIARTGRQIELLVSEDGVFTEHSTGYQEFNINLLQQLMSTIGALNRKIPDQWVARYEAAIEFYLHTRRPDESLPRQGDTLGPSDELQDLPNGLLRQPIWFSPEFGYWSQWQNDAHLFVNWALFPSLVHKHADELSVHFWAAREDWFTASGYWPYGDIRRAEAIGWRGSNAPHELGEKPGSQRKSSVIGSHADNVLTLLHLRRVTDSGYSVDRIFINIVDLWLVIDAPASGDAVTQSIWQLPPSVSPIKSSDKDPRFVLRSDRSTASLAVEIAHGDGGDHSWVQGEESPFGGWYAGSDGVSSAPAIIIETAASSWSTMAWKVSKETDKKPYKLMELISWDSAESWTIEISSSSGPATLQREGKHLTYDHSIKRHDAVMQVPMLDKGYDAAVTAYFKEDAQYPAKRDFLPWRFKVFVLAMVASFLQCVFLILLRNSLRRLGGVGVTMLSLLLVAHTGIGFWLHMVYFSG